MSHALLVAAFLAHPLCRATLPEADAIVHEAQAASARWELPDGLLLAVILAESGGRPIVCRRRCGVDVGWGQVHLHGKPVDRRRLQQLSVLSTNLDSAGKLLDGSRRFCRSRPRWTGCRESAFGRYNSLSRTWWPRVRRIWSRLMGSGGGVS